MPQDPPEGARKVAWENDIWTTMLSLLPPWLCGIRRLRMDGEKPNPTYTWKNTISLLPLTKPSWTFGWNFIKFCNVFISWSQVVQVILSKISVKNSFFGHSCYASYNKETTFSLNSYTEMNSLFLNPVKPASWSFFYFNGLQFAVKICKFSYGISCRG